MKRRRIRGRGAAILLACCVAGSAAAHDDDEGPIALYGGFYEMGSSGGYYQYELRWHFKGSNDGVSHNAYVSSFFRIEWSYTNLDPWYTFRDIKGMHQGNVGPMPNGRWYRFFGGGGLCVGDKCWKNMKAGPLWRPAVECGGRDGGRVGPW